MKWLDPSTLMLGVLFALHLLFAPVAVWSISTMAGPRPEGRVVEFLEFEPVDGALRAKTFYVMLNNPNALDENRVVLMESSGGQLHQVARSRWSLGEPAPEVTYRFVTLAPSAESLAGRRFWLVLK